MEQPTRIEPNGIYDDGTLVLGLGLTSATLSRARREGRLRFTRKGKRVLYLGRWILEWLEGEARPEPKQRHRGGRPPLHSRHTLS